MTIMMLTNEWASEILSAAHSYRSTMTEIQRFGSDKLPHMYTIAAKIKTLYQEAHPFLTNSPDTHLPLDNLDKIAVHFGIQSLYVENLAAVQMNRATYMGKDSTGEQISLIQILDKIKQGNQLHRIEYTKLFSDAMQKINRPFEKTLKALQTHAQELQYASLYDLIQAHSWTDYDQLAKQAEAFLNSTKDQIKEGLNAFFSEFNIEAKMDFDPELVFPNLMYLFLQQEHMFGNFGVESLWHRVNEICQLASLDFLNSPRLTVDIEDRPEKFGTGFLGFRGEPDEISFVLVGRRGNLETLLHEAGHAIHFINIEQSLPPLSQNFGNMVITEAIAILFGSLAQEPSFLNQIAGIEFDIPTQIRYRQTMCLYQKAYQAVRFLNLRDIYKTTNPLTKELFEELRVGCERRFENALGFYRPMHDCFELGDQIMLPATYFEAYTLAEYWKSVMIGMESTQLDKWWENPAALTWLRETIIQPGLNLDLTQFPYFPKV